MVLEILPDYTINERVEVYWPDDDVWLPATVLEVHDSDTLRITWEEDGSESEIPLDYARKIDASNNLPNVAANDMIEICQEDVPGRAPLARHRGAQRDTRPAWMTKGLGIGTKMLGEATGDLLKPGLTRQDLENLERKGRQDLGSDPFGEVFSESASGGAALSKLERSKISVPSDSFKCTNDFDEGLIGEPCFEYRECHTFDGTAVGAFDIPYASEQNPSGSFSVDCWVQAPAGCGSGYRSPLTSRDYPPASGYSFFITPSGHWAFWIGTPEAKEWLKVNSSVKPSGKWQRLTGTYCNRSRSAHLYIDDVSVSSGRSQSDFQPNSQRPLRLGAGASEAAAKFPFTGSIRDIRIYSCALELPLPALVGIDAEEQPPAKKRR